MTVDSRKAFPLSKLPSARLFIKLLLCFALLFAFQPYVGMADTTKTIMLVMFKQSKSTVTAAFEEIIRGIAKHSELQLVEKVIETDSVSEVEMNELIKQENAQALILLGSKTVELFENTNVGIPIITGATLHPISTRQKSYGLSLTADPGLLFSKLHDHAPNIKRIHVVFDTSKNQWLIDIAQHRAKNLGMELISHPSSSLRDSAKVHREIVESINPKSEAIWLLQDTNLVGDTDVLPYLLKEAWEHEIILISSNPVHVQRGALMSLYPDRELTGEELGELALRVLNGKENQHERYLPAKNIRSTLNIRSAAHLGIRFNSDQLSRFDLLFPKK